MPWRAFQRRLPLILEVAAKLSCQCVCKAVVTPRDVFKINTEEFGLESLNFLQVEHHSIIIGPLTFVDQLLYQMQVSLDCQVSYLEGCRDPPTFQDPRVFCNIVGRMKQNLQGVLEPLHVGAIRTRPSPVPCNVSDPSINRVHTLF
jgi:hypothetical protein